MFTAEEIIGFEKIISEKNAAYTFGLELSDILQLMLKSCNEDMRNRYFSLLQDEKDAHSPQVQNELALILMDMGDVLCRQQHPNIPSHELLEETYRSPSLFWAIKAVSQNYIPAYYTEGRLLISSSKDVRADFELSRALVLKGAVDGDPIAQCHLAFDYAVNAVSRGSFVEHDMNKADYWYKKAAEANDPRCFWNLASYYQSFAKVRDYDKAIYYYKEIIRLGNAERYQDPYRELALCYAELNNVEECKKCIYFTLQNRDAAACFYMYDLFDGSGIKFWPVINDINLELALLQRACQSNYEHIVRRANYKLKMNYKKDLFGKVKRRK